MLVLIKINLNNAISYHMNIQLAQQLYGLGEKKTVVLYKLNVSKKVLLNLKFALVIVGSMINVVMMLYLTGVKQEVHIRNANILVKSVWINSQEIVRLINVSLICVLKIVMNLLNVQNIELMELWIGQDVKT